MHLPSRTPSSTAALLALLPLAAAISPATSECVRSSSRQAASFAPCGDEAFVARCLGTLGEYFLQTDIEICYLDGGCGPDEAAALAIDLLTGCASSDDEPEQAGDLRKRQRIGGSNDATTNSNDNKDTDTETATDTDTATATETTTKEATETTEEETAVVTVTSTNSASTSASAASATTSTGAGIEPSDCTSTTTISTTSCGIEDGKNVCVETEIAKTTCRDGLLCRMDSTGVTTCMEERNSLTTGGIIVAIIFSSAIVLAVALMTFFCCRDKRQEKKLRAKQEAAAIAKASGAGKKNRNVSDRVPLMAQAQESYGGQEYNTAPPPPEQQGGQRDPFQDQHRF